MHGKTAILFCTISAIMTLMSACQNSPEKDVIISKNDGSFDANAIVSAEETHAPDATQAIQHTEGFFSTDQSVEIIMDLDSTVTGADMPVVEVEPHYLTEEEAKNAAYALLGDVEFYEWQHYSDAVLSKSEILEKINRWSQFTNQDAIDNLYGQHMEDAVRVVKVFIEEYTNKLESASDVSNKVPCQWTFKKAPYYLFSAADAANEDTSNESDMLKATTTVNGVPFTYCVETRNQDDYKVNYIRYYMDSDSPLGIDRTYFTAKLCRTEKPTEDQLSAVKATAKDVLEKLNLGQWQIDTCYVNETPYGNITEYSIIVTAMPVLEGITTIKQQPVANLNDPDVYASNYQMPSVEFQYSPDGQLIFFLLQSPIDCAKLLNSNVIALPMSELLEKAKSHFELSTLTSYDTEGRLGSNSSNIKCKLNVNEVKYTLSRIRVPETDASYYYIPTLTLLGSAEFQDKETGETYFVNEEMILLSLNAVDGTIINSTNF